jgi:excisionase family DNA binding protein
MHSQKSNIRLEDKLALRVNEAAAVSGLSRSTLYELLKAGKLRAVKIGGRRLILREDLQALLHSGIQ